MSVTTEIPNVVSGPASSTANAVARFSDTGGATLKDSGVTVDDDDNVTTAGGIRLLSDDLVHYIQILAGVGMAANATIKMPLVQGQSSQALRLGGDGLTLEWFTPLSGSVL